MLHYAFGHFFLRVRIDPWAIRRRCPSATEDEAKTQYAALEKGVTTLLERGYGRERVSNELMNEIADGCAPDEEEVSYIGMGGMAIIQNE